MLKQAAHLEPFGPRGWSRCIQLAHGTRLQYGQQGPVGDGGEILETETRAGTPLEDELPNQNPMNPQGGGILMESGRTYTTA